MRKLDEIRARIPNEVRHHVDELVKTIDYVHNLAKPGCKRKGRLKGSKNKKHKEPTVVKRIPISKLEAVEKLIKVNVMERQPKLPRISILDILDAAMELNPPTQETSIPSCVFNASFTRGAEWMRKEIRKRLKKMHGQRKHLPTPEAGLQL